MKMLNCLRPVLRKIHAKADIATRSFAVSTQSGQSWSYDHGVSDVPLMHKTIGDIFKEKVEQNPDKDLFVFARDGVRKTYSQFLHDAEKMGSALISLGLEPGDRVGMWGPNTYEWAVTQFATSLAGLIMATINPAYQVGELEYCLNKIGVKALVTAPSFKTQDYHQMLLSLCPEMKTHAAGTVPFKRFPQLKHIIAFGDEHKGGTHLWHDVIEAGDSASDRKLKELKVQPDDPVNIQFTSGTTGSPKGAILSHNNIVNNAFFIGLRGGFQTFDPIICCAPPLFHCFGCVGASLAGIVHNATVVFPSPSFEPKACLETIEAEKCTTVYGTPTMFVDMLGHRDFKNHDYSSVNGGCMAGAPCPIELCNKIVNNFGMANFILAYGSTETSPVVLTSLLEESVATRYNSVGVTVPHAENKVVDMDGKIVPRGEQGELWSRGYVTFLGYWEDEAKTKEAMGSDRWYRSGDLAVMNEDNRVAIVGRKKDMIIRGGENIYPTEVEQFLFTHPKIQDIHVIGVPDERMGEEVCAWVRLVEGQHATDEEIKSFCKGKLSHFKVPRYILFKELHDFPVTASGKVKKFEMREHTIEELRLVAQS